MTVSDPIADLLTRIRNAMHARHRYVDIGWSKIKEEIAKVLKDEGFIEEFLVRKDKSIGTLRVMLRYKKHGVELTRESRPVIQGLERVSKPGRRQYIRKEEIRGVLGGLGESIMTTSKGVMTGRKARQAGLGGELLCRVW
jgi:small subunit ribosomal protein S8